MSEELADDLKNGVQKDYAKMLRNLKYAVAQLYEDYGSQGKLNWDELQKYNRLSKFNKEINGIVKDDMKPAWKRIKGGLQDNIETTWDKSMGAMASEVSVPLERNLTADEIQEILQKPVSGWTWDERVALRQNDLGVRLGGEVRASFFRSDTYQDAAKRVKDMTERDYIKTARMIDNDIHQMGQDTILYSQEEAQDKGVFVTKTWVTAGDDRVREDHAAMDGVTVDADEDFVLPNGERAPAPGMFGDPAEDYNCRCWIISNVEER